MHKTWILLVLLGCIFLGAFWRLFSADETPNLRTVNTSSTHNSKGGADEPSSQRYESKAVLDAFPKTEAVPALPELKLVIYPEIITGSLELKTLLLAPSLNANEQLWLAERSYPTSDSKLGSLPEQELMRLAEDGDLVASYFWMMKKIDQGVLDAHGAPPLRKSVFVYRLRAAFELGLIGSGWLSGNFKYKSPRNLINGVAMDIIAQRLGEESLLPILTANAVSIGEVPPIISFADLDRAQELADQEFRLAQRFGLKEGTQIRFGERRRMSMVQRAP